MSAEMVDLDRQLASSDDDSRLVVVFSKVSHYDDAKSRDEGRAVYEMRDYVSIRVPGDKDTEITRPVEQRDIQRFPTHWQRYQSSQEQVVGTPLVAMGTLTPAQIDEFKYFGVRTVEQLASLADGNAQKFMGANALKQQAQLWLKTQESDKPMALLRAELMKRDEKLAVLEKLVSELQAKSGSAKG